MVALSARRLVWLAMLLINWTTLPMRWAALARPPITVLAWVAPVTAVWQTLVDCVTWRVISEIEAANSSAAEATARLW